MGHLNIISLFWLVLLVFYSRYLLKLDEKVRTRFLKVQLSLTLLYNIGMLFVFPWKYPIELSTTSYFIVPIIVLLNIKSLKVWGVYTSILTGGIYFIAMLTVGNYLYGNYPAYSVYTSIYNHGALLSFAYVTLKTMEFRKSERIIIWIGIVFSAAWAYALRPIVTFTGRIFIYEVLDGLLIKTYFSNSLVIGYSIYYILLVGGLILSANMVHSLSNKIYNPNQYKNLNSV